MSGTTVLVEALAAEVARKIAAAPDGHCVRIDDVDDSMAADMASRLQALLPECAVHTLSKFGDGPQGITAERAIEIRNRKETACLLLVPAGQGHAASSLDNSFERVPALTVYAAAEKDLIRRLGGTPLGQPLQGLARRVRVRHTEWWIEFLSELLSEPTEANFGRNLWRIGLVPDFGEAPWDRIDRNVAATRSISQPSRPTASLDERFTSGGLSDGSWRAPLRAFCEAASASLANSRRWCEAILVSADHLTFDRWKLAEAEEADLDSVEIEPFLRHDGTPDPASKLVQGADGQLVLKVPVDGTAPLVVKWKTTPMRVVAVSKWLLEVLPPDDMRTEDSEPLATVTVKGDKRRGTLKVSVDEDALAAGSRFVVVLTGLGEGGEIITLTTGDPASADSQEFQVVAGADPGQRTRRSAAVSLGDASLRAALDGMNDLAEDLVTWDLAGQVFGVRLGNKRAVQIRVNEILIGLQRELSANPTVPVHFEGYAHYGALLDQTALARQTLDLPTTLRKSRADFLASLATRHPRDTAESVQWDAELREQARSYAATYRRALDSADSDALRDLLLLDSISLAVRSNNSDIHSVVLLPIHPLRLLWVSEHDAMLREWAGALIEVEPKGARKSRVDAAQTSRVIPANLPFTVSDADGRIALYTEELTHGCGLYLVPSDNDTEGAADAVCSVLGMMRAGSALHASSAMVAERFQAYESSHDPSETLRLLSLHPGSGDLVAGALGREFNDEPDSESDDSTNKPHRFEVICYTDSTSYTRPVPALLELQRSVRGKDVRGGGSHLFPPLSLSVRPADRMLDDVEVAHLAVVQDIGVAATGIGEPTDRMSSLRDLLVPIVTRSREESGDLIWESVPATGARPGKSDSELSAAHRAHQKALVRMSGRVGTAVPVVQVSLDGDRLARIRTAHERADWVVGIDRFVGVDLFEGGPDQRAIDSYILDYAPDFVEGIGDRLTVTTNNRREVEALLDHAMRELNLEVVEQSVGGVLRTLAVVSGRLALRLLGDSTLAREAVSLAAVVTHLRERGELDGLIVVPVDAHPEIFGPSVREADVGARRCDLLLVRVGQRSFKIECVEVKSRLEARLPQALADRIVEQLTDTRRLLESRFFAADPPRIDAELQRARLASVLHYYADRSLAHGVIGDDKIEDIHRYIDRIEDSGEVAEITMRGFVISLEGDKGFHKKYGDVAMSVVTADDLGRIGLTTRRNDADPGSIARDGDEAGGSGSADIPPIPTPISGSPGARREPPTERQDDAPPTDSSSDLAPPTAKDADASAVETADDESSAELESRSPSEGAGADAQQPATASSSARRESVEVVLGQVESGTDVTWRISTKGSPHAFIIGIPGQGKSVTTRKIIRDFSEQSLPSVVFDFHGDMAANPPEGATVLNAADGLPFSPFEPDVSSGRRINVTAWEIAEVIGYVAKLGEIQRNHVYKALVAAYTEYGWVGTEIGEGLPTLEEFGDALETVEAGARGKNARDRLRPFTDFGLFAEGASGGFEIRGGHKGLVLDVSKIGLEEVQRFAASFLLRRIYREMFGWGQAASLRLAVVLDEAHRLSRDVTLPKIMKEGRKYGVSVVVASQSADDFHADVLGNAGAKIVFRTNYPASKSVAGFLRGRSGSDLSQEIEKLGVGVAYVATPDSAQARRVYMTQ